MRTIGTCLMGGIALAIITMHPVQLNAQRTRYKLIDLGTFGGPQSYIADGADITAVRALNNKKIFTGWADTSASDPFPDFCWEDSSTGVLAATASPVAAGHQPVFLAIAKAP